MGGEICTLKIGYTVPDEERLPEGVTPEDVVEAFTQTIDEAAQRFHREHPGWLACEPT